MIFSKVISLPLQCTELLKFVRQHSYAPILHTYTSSILPVFWSRSLAEVKCTLIHVELKECILVGEKPVICLSPYSFHCSFPFQE